MGADLRTTLNLVGFLVFGFAVPSAAQEQPNASSLAEDWRVWQPDPSTIEMPVLSFDADDDAAKDYDKYFYFHRVGTDFETAFADIRECDARARGLWLSPARRVESGNLSPYGVAGDVVNALIFKPAQDKLFRRANLRRCMFYKGYSRYGLPKVVWETFNFQRVGDDFAEQRIQTMLAQQALVASGAKPNTLELGL